MQVLVERVVGLGVHKDPSTTREGRTWLKYVLWTDDRVSAARWGTLSTRLRTPRRSSTGAGKIHPCRWRRPRCTSRRRVT